MRLPFNRIKLRKQDPNDGLQIESITFKGKINGKDFQENVKLNKHAVSQQTSTDTKNITTVDSATSNALSSKSSGSTSQLDTAEGENIEHTTMTNSNSSQKAVSNKVDGTTVASPEGTSLQETASNCLSNDSPEDEEFDDEMLQENLKAVFPPMYNGLKALLEGRDVGEALKILRGFKIPDQENQMEAVEATNLCEFVKHLGLSRTKQGTLLGEIRSSKLAEFTWDDEKDQWVDPKAKNASESESFV